MGPVNVTFEGLKKCEFFSPEKGGTRGREAYLLQEASDGVAEPSAGPPHGSLDVVASGLDVVPQLQGQRFQERLKDISKDL